MELLIAILIAFGFVSGEDAAKLDRNDAIKIFNQNNLEEKAEQWTRENGSSIWEDEADDFIWEDEADDF